MVTMVLLLNTSQHLEKKCFSSLALPSRARTNALKSHDYFFSIAEIYDCVEITKRVDPRELDESSAAVDWIIFMLALSDWGDDFIRKGMRDAGFDYPESIYTEID